MRPWHRFRPITFAYAAAFMFLIGVWGCPDTSLPLLDMTGGKTCTREEVMPSSPGTVVVHFIDVGQGDGMWLRLPSGDPGNPVDVVVDVGDRPYKYPGDTTVDGGLVIAEYLEAHGMEPGSLLEWLVITHGDSDHSGGAPTLLERYAVLNFLGSGYEDRTETWETVRSEIRGKVLALDGEFVSPIESPDGAESGLSTPFVTSEVLWGTSYLRRTTSNDSGVVLRISAYGKSILLTGDIGEDVEEELVFLHNAKVLNLASHVLKVPHHGSDNSNSEDFLNAVYGSVPVEQRFGVIQSGRRSFNGVTLPREEILSRLRTYLIANHLLSTEHDDEEKSSGEAPGDDHVVLTIKQDGTLNLCYNPGSMWRDGGTPQFGFKYSE